LVSLLVSRPGVIASFEQEHENPPASPAPNDALEVLLRFGAALLRAGNTAIRTRESMEAMAPKLGFDAVAVSLSLDSATVSVRRSGEWTTAMREIGSPGINAWRIAELEQLARTVNPGVAPQQIAAKLADIELAPPRYSDTQIVAAIAVASGGFAFLNGSPVLEMIAAAIGGGIGQWLRSWLTRRQLNQYGVAALSGAAAAGSYVLAVTLASHLGFGFARHPAGFIASVLFLVPGFPLIAGLFDLLQHQIVAAVSRLAYGVMMLLAVALGLSVIVALAAVDLSPQPSPDLSYPLKLLLRALASFAAGSTFAMLFNNSARTVLVVGLLALAANGLRLALHDAGMMPAPAAFLSALAIGLTALLVEHRFNIPRIATTVPAIIIMVPGLYAIETIVWFNRGQMLDALQAAASCGFVIGALAMGLAAARFLSRR
jgi:uncharacterized membrane protein YjjP (DUF1212 family)